LKNNAEIDALDLLLEIDQLDMALEYIDKDNIKKIYDYLLASTPFAADGDEYENTLRMAFKFCMKVDEPFLAMRAAMKLDDQSLVEQAFNSCKDPLLQKQLAFSLGRQRLVVETKDQELNDIMSNSRLSQFYQKLLKELDVEKPKHPDDIYKSHLEKKDKSPDLESLFHNLAKTYTNAFVNMASTKDTLMNQETAWIPHVKDAGIMSAVASLGLINMWNIEESTNTLMDYLDLKDGYAKAGACIGLGIAASGVWSDVDPARAILEENIQSKEKIMKLGASIGLGLAYAGTAREEFKDILCPLITDLGLGPDTAGFAALSLGLIFVSKCDEDVINTVLTSLMERPETELSQTSARYFAVALALCYLGQQEKCEFALETLKTIEHPLARYAEVCVEAAAYVGSGNVLKIQEFLKRCIPHEEEAKTQPQAMSVIGIAFIAISEKIGNDMAGRLMNHILQYCDLPVKRALPIAVGMLNISNPSITATDLLNKLAHDEDKEMSMRAIFSLGLIGLGTNNAR
jgi:26S proteasome regulatory subunit N1